MSQSRRRFLEVGALASFAAATAEVMRCRAAAAETVDRQRDTAVILVWLTGGLTHMDTYDLPVGPCRFFRRASRSASYYDSALGATDERGHDASL